MASSINQLSELDIRDGHLLALKWFEVHADQRMKLVQYYSSVAGLCITGLGFSIQNKSAIVAYAFCFLIIVFSFSFKFLDMRTRQLIKVGENALAQTTKKLVLITNIPELNLITLAEENHCVPSYKTTLNILFFVVVLVGFGGIFAAWNIVL